MKNIIVCNLSNKKHLKHYKKYTNAQIDNSLSIGWDKKDIVLVTNFPYSYRDIKSVIFDFDCDFCLTGSKTFAMVKLFESGLINCNSWLHDLDVWQTCEFDFPEIIDLGMTRYIGRWQGGSVFLKPSSRDIFEKIAEEIRKQKSRKEEPIIKRVLRIKEYGDRVTKIDNSYNVGATGFEKRHEKSQKPIKAIHMHPHRGTDINRNISGMNRLGAKTVGKKLFDLFRAYFNLPKGLADDASIEIDIDTNEYNIKSLCAGEKFHTNRRFGFTDIPTVLDGRKFLVLPHKKQIKINISVKNPGIFEVGLCNEHKEIISSFEYPHYYDMSHINLETNYRDAKKIRLFRRCFGENEILRLNHQWRVNPIIIAKDIVVKNA